MTASKSMFMVIMAAMALSWAATVAADQFPATGQTTVYRTGDDGDIQAGATLRYKDNGDGTITDKNTNLTWEKKSDDGSIHDKDNVYTWDEAFDVHVAELNTEPCFARRCDWRLPNVKEPNVKELQSIVNYEVVFPSVSPEFNANCVTGVSVTDGSCTAFGSWSSTTCACFSDGAWGVSFDDGTVGIFDKIVGFPVRAVRGGL